MDNSLKNQIRKLESSIVSVRKSGANALGKAGDPNAVRPLIKALKDKSYHVGASAAEALGNIGDPIAIQPLVEALKDKSRTVSLKAAEALGKIGNTSVLHQYTDALKDKEPDIRIAAADILGKLGASGAAPPLIEALKDKDHNVRISAANALGNIKEPLAIHPLIDALKDHDYRVRTSAVNSLGNIGDPVAIQPIVDALDMKAVNFYGRISGKVIDKNTVTFYWSAMKSVDRISIANQPFKNSHLYLLCSKCFLKTVKKKVISGVFNKSHIFVACRGCGTCLHLIKNVNRVTGLIGSNIKDFRVSNKEVYINLWSETEKRARNADIDILEIRNDVAISYDYAVSRLLTILTRPAEDLKQIPVIIQGNPPLSGETKKIIKRNFGGKVDNPAKAVPLIIALKDSNQYARKSAAKELGKTGDSGAVGPLVNVLNDLSADVRINTAEALGKIGSTEAVQPLINALKDNEFYARAAASRALGEICDIRAMHSLVRVFREDKDEYVRNCASEAIENMINSNKPYQESYPHLICKKCFLKTKENEIEAGVFKKFVYVACRGCNTWLHLIQDIRTSVGVVGGDFEDYYTDKDRIYINLWSEQEKKAGNADIDILEIRSNSNISYDYAINALLITLKNDASRPTEYVKQIPAVIEKNAVIPESVRVILEHEFGGIKE
ncbi:MAG: HEAT repeat domain-containing protein [Desulfobacterales bacterium]|nr:HEAT repeat domain-containing protein [Desulfobacterales bacterium]